MRRGDKTCEQRYQAAFEGRSRYSTGRPCAKGHVSERYTNGGACVKCTSLANRKNHERNGSAIRARVSALRKSRRNSKDTWVVEVLRVAKSRSRKRGMKFDISPEDIVIPDLCPVLGVKLQYKTLGNRSFRPSLDRFDNEKGYVKGNVRVISCRANQIKNDASIRDVEMVLNYMRGVPGAWEGDVASNVGIYREAA